MSVFSWLSPRKKPEASDSILPSSGLSRMDSTRPFHHASGNGAHAQPANRKQERLERRELLYAVVREAMVRAGVLSSSYKFKVLSLDPRGRQFMVMVELAQGASSDTSRLAEVEVMIAQSAKARHDILVSAVYWRANEHVAIGDAAHFIAHKPLISQPAPLMEQPSRPAPLTEQASRPAPLAGQASRPAPLMGQSSRPAPLTGQSSRPAPLTGQSSRPAPLTQQASPAAPLAEPVSRPAELRAGPPSPTPSHRFDPLQDDEVAAFRKALETGVRGEQALAAVGNAPHSYALLTGFEDTEIAEGEAQQLSATQYGALR